MWATAAEDAPGVAGCALGTGLDAGGVAATVCERWDPGPDGRAKGVGWTGLAGTGVFTALGAGNSGAADCGGTERS
jgi:hypothetical protein